MIHPRPVLRAVLATALLGAASARATPPDPAAVARGQKAFDRYCISCHGVNGDGRGPTADWIDPRPRILTSGVFKFRSTPSGELPTDADLERTITNGLHLTYMPRWAPISGIERRDLVEFVKSLSPRFTQEPQGKPIAIPPSPPVTPQLVQQGRQVWEKLQCAACHGETGKGDGQSASTLRDDWGFPISPRDFTEGPLKVGERPEDLYKAFMTGLNGSPMPSYADTASPEDAWALVAFVRSLRHGAGHRVAAATPARMPTPAAPPAAPPRAPSAPPAAPSTPPAAPQGTGQDQPASPPEPVPAAPPTAPAPPAPGGGRTD